MSTTLEQHLTLTEVCKLLTLKRRTVYRRMGDRADPLPFKKLGRRICFDPKAVAEWLARHEVTSHRGED